MRFAIALGALALAVLGVALVGRDRWFDEPSTIAALYALPLAVAAAAFGFAVLGPSGRLVLASLLVTAIVTDTGFRASSWLRDPVVETGAEPDYYTRDPDLGWAALPGAQARAWKGVDGRRVYEVGYRFDARGRRVTPVEGGGRDRFLLGFGGSFMFGEGVDERETLLFETARRAPAWRPYNYAFHGYGPPHLLARLEAGGLRDEVAEPRGVLAYLFIDAHVLRSIGSMIVHTGWAHRAPYYVLDAGSTPRRAGDLTTGRPLTALLYSALGQSGFVRRTGIDLPLRITPSHVEHTARLLARAAELYAAAFGPGNRFVVIVYPGSSLAAQLVGALDALGVEALDYSGLFDPAAPGLYIPDDWHPSVRAHRLLAERLARDLSSDAAFPGTTPEVALGRRPDPSALGPRALQRDARLRVRRRSSASPSPRGRPPR